MERKDTYEVTWIRSGQPRPYADTEYEADVRITRNGELVQWSDEAVKQHVRGIVYPWKDNPDWHEPTLKSFCKVSDGTWRVKVVLASTD